MNKKPEQQITYYKDKDGNIIVEPNTKHKANNEKNYCILTCITTILGILLIINFSNKKFMMFLFGNRPDGIFLQVYKWLFVITDGECCCR